MNKNPNFVLPKTFLVGQTKINLSGLILYLEETNQLEFLEDITQAKNEGLSEGEILCSFYAKLCYASLTNKKNKNISKIRSIHDNIIATIDSQHGSVFEHCYLNFVTTDTSRVFTHELVRHRQGTSFSQTSGRYVRSDELKLVIDPILEPVYEDIEEVRIYLENKYKTIGEKLGIENMTDFDRKKKITSAMRRILPNGQANEIGFGVNIRSLRFTIQQRTSRHAEWEIRVIFNQIVNILFDKYPLIFSDVRYVEIDGQNEYTFKNHKI